MKEDDMVAEIKHAERMSAKMFLSAFKNEDGTLEPKEFMEQIQKFLMHTNGCARPKGKFCTLT